MRNIGYNIRKIRESKNYTQDYIASELGVTTLAYGNIERGTTFPNSNRIQQIAKILDVEPQDLFEDIDAINILAPVHNSAVGYNNQNTTGVSEQVLQNTNKILEKMLLILEQLSAKK